MYLTSEELDLLKHAAHAIGYDILYDPTFEVWNPLISDHHAFGLAVKLNILLREEFREILTDFLSKGIEPHHATRQAIVTVAAYQGRIKLSN